MAQYKVPQDVEAEDKLLGPFTFRQFIYLLIMFGLIALGFLFVRIGIWPLIIILVPPFVLLGILALPLKKDQPMETYLSAIVSFHLKPRKRIWDPGQPNSTIEISAPKQVEDNRTKDLSQEEASRRLSFLADIVDTEGYAIKGSTPNSALREEVYAEANTAQDIFENNQSSNLNKAIQNSNELYHQQADERMRNAIENNYTQKVQNATINHYNETSQQPMAQQEYVAQEQPVYQEPVMPQPAQQYTAYQAPALPEPVNYSAGYYDAPQNYVQPQQQSTDVIAQQFEQVQQPEQIQEQYQPAFQEDVAQTEQLQPESYDQSLQNSDTIIQPDFYTEESTTTEEATSQEENKPTQDMIDLANNTDYSNETLAKQAKRVQEKNNNGEVYISLH